MLLQAEAMPAAVIASVNTDATPWECVRIRITAFLLRQDNSSAYSRRKNLS